jgi:hypothetical protein
MFRFYSLPCVTSHRKENICFSKKKEERKKEIQNKLTEITNDNVE